MTELWYENPKILLDNPDQFLPSREQNHIQKINALVRLAIYWAIIIYILQYDNKWFAVSIVIILISFFFGTNRKFFINRSKV